EQASPENTFGGAREPAGAKPAQDVWTGRRRINRKERAGGFLVEVEPEIELSQNRLPARRSSSRAKMGQQVGDYFFRPVIPPSPGKPLAQFPFVKPTEQICVIGLVRFGQPGIKNRSFFSLPPNELNLPFWESHVSAKAGKNERTE